MVEKHLMIDFETLDTRPTSALLSLGAVLFTPTKILTNRYWAFDLDEQLRLGRTVSASTLHWWFEQETAALQVFDHTRKIGTKLDIFFQHFRDLCPEEEFNLWGNGADFDIAILSNLYEGSKWTRPWKYGNARCYRTLNKIYGLDVGMAFAGTKHNALDDAAHQAKCLQNYLVTHDQETKPGNGQEPKKEENGNS